MKQSEKTRELLIQHCKRYPHFKSEDIFKFLYQSTFGCEHMVRSSECAADYIQKEYDSTLYTEPSTIEELDGDYSRISLSYLSNGLSATTLGKLFCLSAKNEHGNIEDLKEKISVAATLVSDGSIAISPLEFFTELKKWEAEGYPALHHSDTFKREYHPSYRVISNRYIKFLPLFSELDKRLKDGPVKLAIEGGSASGKTTLAALLESIYDCTVFHMDDFFLRPEQRTPARFAEIGGNVDRERFLEEILIPLSENRQITYRPFDCSTFSLLPAINITSKPLTVVDGAYSMHPELEKYYDLSVFLDISSKYQRERIEKRNSPELAVRFFNEWIPLEVRYFDGAKVKERCDIVISVG